MTHGPLTGVRIIEMEAIGPVPMAGMILSGLGAEIVRVRRAASHDGLQLPNAGIIHRGRFELALDVKQVADKATLLALIDHADAIIEGNRPGVMERLGLGPDVCHARNPRLVYGRMTGWGQDGPLAPTAGHDLNYIAITGALHAMGPAKGPPPVPLNLIGDYAGGSLFLALGLVSAIMHARQTGEGQVVDAAMVDGVTNIMSMFHDMMPTGAWRDRPQSNLLDGAAPFYRCYLCADGKSVSVGALEPKFFAALLAGLGLEAAGFMQYDTACWPEMAATFSAQFASKSRDEWAVVFDGTDACVAPVLSMTEAMEHPANVERGVYAKVDGVSQAAPAPRFSATPGTIRATQEISAAELLTRWAG